jgi:hypothetical protein
MATGAPRSRRLNRKALEGTRLNELFALFDQDPTKGADPNIVEANYIRNIWNLESDSPDPVRRGYYAVFRQSPEKNFRQWYKRCGADWIIDKGVAGSRRTEQPPARKLINLLFVPILFHHLMFSILVC